MKGSPRIGLAKLRSHARLRICVICCQLFQPKGE
jgi:hypothetical protein